MNIVPKPSSYQYDLVLSPVINRAERPHDVRIVVRWVNVGPLFVSGFLQWINADDLSPARLESFPRDSVNQMNYWLGYSRDTLGYATWYHGLGSTANGTTISSFTVDTQSMWRTKAFYVRLPQQNEGIDPGIARYKNSAKLAVDIYLPEDDANPLHYGKPSRTFYLSEAQDSDNPSAPYWEVFALKTANEVPNIADRIVSVNRIVTKLFYP
jgi:hypothetical protein